jgi:argininosuccinate lyase
VHADRMAQAASGGFTNATDLADYLVGKGLPFRSAHEIAGKLVRHCAGLGIALGDLDLAGFQAFSPLIGADVFDAIKLENCVNRRKIPGAPAREAVLAAIENARKRFMVI